MRLVKAATALLAVLGCDAPSPRPTTTDCSHVILAPVAPHLMALSPDGGVVDEGACPAAACLFGGAGAWARRFGAEVLVTVGDRQVSFPHQQPMSTQIGHAGAPGVAFGLGLAILDRGDHLEVIDSRGQLPATLPRPELPAGGLIVSVRRESDGLAALVTHGRSTTLLTLKSARDPNTRNRMQRKDILAPEVEAFGDPPTRVVLHSGRERPVTTDARLVGMTWAPSGVILGLSDGSAQYVREEGSTVHATISESFAPWIGGVAKIDARARSYVRIDATGPEREILRADPTRDLHGTPLPAGAAIERSLFAVFQEQALVIERIRKLSCAVEDRVHLVNLDNETVLTIASGDGLRMHPTFAGDRFRFVEADASYTFP